MIAIAVLPGLCPGRTAIAIICSTADRAEHRYNERQRWRAKQNLWMIALLMGVACCSRLGGDATSESNSFGRHLLIQNSAYSILSCVKVYLQDNLRVTALLQNRGVVVFQQKSCCKLPGFCSNR
jgi:hypothetical protein